MDPYGGLSDFCYRDNMTIMEELPPRSQSCKPLRYVVEESVCSNFTCCGLILADLHELLKHYEDVHIHMEGEYADIPFVTPHNQSSFKTGKYNGSITDDEMIPVGDIKPRARSSSSSRIQGSNFVTKTALGENISSISDPVAVPATLNINTRSPLGVSTKLESKRSSRSNLVYRSDGHITSEDGGNAFHEEDDDEGACFTDITTSDSNGSFRRATEEGLNPELALMSGLSLTDDTRSFPLYNAFRSPPFISVSGSNSDEDDMSENRENGRKCDEIHESGCFIPNIDPLLGMEGTFANTELEIIDPENNENNSNDNALLRMIDPVDAPLYLSQEHQNASYQTTAVRIPLAYNKRNRGSLYNPEDGASPSSNMHPSRVFMMARSPSAPPPFSTSYDDNELSSLHMAGMPIDGVDSTKSIISNQAHLLNQLHQEKIQAFFYAHSPPETRPLPTTAILSPMTLPQHHPERLLLQQQQKQQQEKQLQLEKQKREEEEHRRLIQQQHILASHRRARRSATMGSDETSISSLSKNSDSGSLQTFDLVAVSTENMSITDLSQSSITSGSQEEHRPYVCRYPGCEKTYKNANGLKYHSIHGHLHGVVPPPSPIVKSHEKPYKCPHLNCGKRYKNANGLKYHLSHGHIGSSGVLKHVSTVTSSNASTNTNPVRVHSRTATTPAPSHQQSRQTNHTSQYYYRSRPQQTNGSGSSATSNSSPQASMMSYMMNIPNSSVKNNNNTGNNADSSVSRTVVIV
jgi:hypothetical protein